MKKDCDKKDEKKEKGKKKPVHPGLLAFAIGEVAKKKK